MVLRRICLGIHTFVICFLILIPTLAYFFFFSFQLLSFPSVWLFVEVQIPDNQYKVQIPENYSFLKNR